MKIIIFMIFMHFNILIKPISTKQNILSQRVYLNYYKKYYRISILRNFLTFNQTNKDKEKYIITACTPKLLSKVPWE